MCVLGCRDYVDAIAFTWRRHGVKARRAPRQTHAARALLFLALMEAATLFLRLGICSPNVWLATVVADGRAAAWITIGLWLRALRAPRRG